jgi:hypothetical protein
MWPLSYRGSSGGFGQKPTWRTPASLGGRQQAVRLAPQTILLRVAGLDPRSMPIPSLSHRTDTFERLKSASGEAKRHAIVSPGSPFSRNTRSNSVKALISFVDSSAGAL